MVKNKQKKRRMTAEQKRNKKLAQSFRQSIEQIFTFAGFRSLKTNGKNLRFAGFPIEIDHCFLFENVMVLCEDTINYYAAKREAEAQNLEYKRNHKLEKKHAIDAILEKQDMFIQEMKALFSEISELQDFASNEIIIKYLYFDYQNNKLSEEEALEYSPIVFVSPAVMAYFKSMSGCIKKSFRFELFRFLGIPKDKIGFATPDGGQSPIQIKTPIIYPRNVTGLNSGIRLVSFMMSPQDLIENGYVLRKDSWDDKEDLYQRLIIQKKIEDVRRHIASERQTFFNNIIVTLPDGVKFYDTTGEKEINLTELVNYNNQVIMQVPKDYNSIAIIDGQHRVYGYYESNLDDKNEIVIKPLRSRMNLLVTGIIYPDTVEWKAEINRRKFEGSLFVSINKNAKSVDSDTLIRVQSIMDDTSQEAIARKILEELNKTDPFKGMFQLSKLAEGRIKTASIIQYALVYLVTPRYIDTSLFKYWIEKQCLDKDYRIKSEDVPLYVKYCKNILVEYFKAVRHRFQHEWNDHQSKILNIISINAFILALKESLVVTNGPKDFSYYTEIFRGFSFSFYDTADEKFKYSGSRYKAFAETEIVPLFYKDK